jgi:hypothetical protein
LTLKIEGKKPFVKYIVNPLMKAVFRDGLEGSPGCISSGQPEELKRPFIFWSNAQGGGG